MLINFYEQLRHSPGGGSTARHEPYHRNASWVHGLVPAPFIQRDVTESSICVRPTTTTSLLLRVFPFNHDVSFSAAIGAGSMVFPAPAVNTSNASKESASRGSSVECAILH